MTDNGDKANGNKADDLCVSGDVSGAFLPATPDALIKGGTRFLTEAFHRFGSMAKDNAVIRIVAAKPCHAGNSGQKLFLSVAYRHNAADLPEQLFVKFSRDFADAFRDRRRSELGGEVRMARLSRHPAFPIAVPKPMFADFHGQSGTGILITEQIPFGRDGIMRSHEKCRDHLLDNAFEHYQATTRALARLAGADQAGALSPEIDALFPWDGPAAMADLPIPYTAADLREKVAAFGALIRLAPQFFAPSVRDPAFLVRFEHEALTMLAHEQAIRAYLYHDQRFVALSHWNSNLDNAWFWRAKDGVLDCGLMDWGMARRMNLGFALWGGYSAASGAMLSGRLDALLRQFAADLAANGGAVVSHAELSVHFDLALAVAGLALMMDLPALINTRRPGVIHEPCLDSPGVRADPVVHGFLQVTTNFLMLWATRPFGKSLEQVLKWQKHAAVSINSNSGQGQLE